MQAPIDAILPPFGIGKKKLLEGAVSDLCRLQPEAIRQGHRMRNFVWFARRFCVGTAHLERACRNPDHRAMVRWSAPLGAGSRIARWRKEPHNFIKKLRVRLQTRTQSAKLALSLGVENERGTALTNESRHPAWGQHL